MGKLVRVVLVLGGLAAIAVIGVQGAAWAERLGIGGPTPAGGAPLQQSGIVSSLPVQVQPAEARPQGTVITVPPVADIVPGSLVIVGNCATAFTASVPAGVAFTATVVDQGLLPTDFPGNLLSCGIRVDALPVSADLGAEINLCFPVPPTKAGLAFDHDTQQWVKTTEEASNGQSCVKLLVDNPNPSFAALFEQ